LVKVREKFWFWLNDDEHVVPGVSVNFNCVEPDYSLFLVLWVSKRNDKQLLQVDIALQHWIFCLKTNASSVNIFLIPSVSSYLQLAKYIN